MVVRARGRRVAGGLRRPDRRGGDRPCYGVGPGVESRRALVAGDTLIDRGNGLEFPVDWANKGVPPEQILEALRPLLELPVELVLATHGGPTDRAALERALLTPNLLWVLQVG